MVMFFLPGDSPITSCHCYTSGGDCYVPGVTTALWGAGYYPPSSSVQLIRSKSSSLCPNTCSHSRAQHLPLEGSSKGPSYPTKPLQHLSLSSRTSKISGVIRIESR